MEPSRHSSQSTRSSLPQTLPNGKPPTIPPSSSTKRTPILSSLRFLITLLIPLQILFLEVFLFFTSSNSTNYPHFDNGNALAHSLNHFSTSSNNNFPPLPPLPPLLPLTPVTPPRYICPSAKTLFHNTTELEVAIQHQIEFHQRGGNLASVEQYLNGHMQSTLDKLDVRFVPNDPKDGKDGRPRKDSIEVLKEYYKSHKVKRGGYGQPLPGKFVDSKSEGGNNVNNGNNGNSGNNVKQALAGERWINIIEPDTSERFTAAIGTVGPTCGNVMTFGKGYEEKTFCVPVWGYDDVRGVRGHGNRGERKEHGGDGRNGEDLEAGLGGERNQECHIFSIGSNDQWGFESEVLEKLPHCITHTFDCTLKDNTPRKKPPSDNIQFYPHCIASTDHHPDGENGDDAPNSRYLPYHKLYNLTMERLQQTTPKSEQTHDKYGSHDLPHKPHTPHTPPHTPPPKLLKLDVEGFEFTALPTLLQTSPPHTWPEQIMMEVHWATRMVDVEWMLRTRQAGELTLFFGILFNFGGYLPVYVKYFPGCGPCLEVLLVRAVCE